MKPSSLRVYAADWRDFLAWCAARGASPLPAEPDTILVYIASAVVDRKAASTIGRRLAAIAYYHRSVTPISPTLDRRIIEFTADMRANLKPRLAIEVTDDAVLGMLALCPDTLIGKRDRALLAFGFTGAIRRRGVFRRDDVVALKVADVAHVDETRGYRLRPVEAVQTWLAAAEISSGPVFRAVALGGRVGIKALSGDSVARIVKRYAGRVGLEPFGHQLRMVA